MCQSHTGHMTGLWFLPSPAFKAEYLWMRLIVTFYVRVGRKFFFPVSLLMMVEAGGGELIVPVQRRTCLSVTQPNVTSSTKQSPSWDACSSSASQEITIHFMKPEGSLLRSQHLSFVHILSQINPLHNLPSNFFKNYFNIVFISSSCMCYLSGFATYSLCVSLSPIYATCPAYLILISPNLI